MLYARNQTSVRKGKLYIGHIMQQFKEKENFLHLHEFDILATVMVFFCKWVKLCFKRPAVDFSENVGRAFD